eukprot:2518749-Amphidinium_carterae.2
MTDKASSQSTGGYGRCDLLITHQPEILVSLVRPFLPHSPQRGSRCMCIGGLPAGLWDPAQGTLWGHGVVFAILLLHFHMVSLHPTLDLDHHRNMRTSASKVRRQNGNTEKLVAQGVRHDNIVKRASCASSTCNAGRRYNKTLYSLHPPSL